MSTPTTAAAKTFLQICQDVAVEAGVSGSQGAMAPLTTANQVGELARIVKWVQRAWRNIQGHRHWDWMWERVTLTLPIGAYLLPQTVDATRYVLDSMVRTDTIQNGFDMEYVPWDEWEDWYTATYIQVGNGPTAWSIRPDKQMIFNGKASVAQTGGDMTFRVSRYAMPTDLTMDADVPGLPGDLADLILYKALVYYANFDEAGVGRQTAMEEIKRMEQDLLARCLPSMRLGGPLA